MDSEGSTQINGVLLSNPVRSPSATIPGKTAGTANPWHLRVACRLLCTASSVITLRRLPDEGYTGWLVFARWFDFQADELALSVARVPVSEEPVLIDDYQLLSRIATGATCQVWEVLEAGTGRTWAMKLLRDTVANYKDERAYLKQESVVAKSVHHPLLMHIERYSQQRDYSYLIMEYFRAANVRNQIKSELNNLHTRTKPLFEGVCQALGALHQAGWIHRDIKPDNVLLSRSGDLRLIDFALAVKTSTGLARMFGGSKVKLIQGTRTYIAPETIRKEAPTFQTDLYSLGVMFFEVLTGKAPFNAPTSNELLQKHLTATPAPPSDLNPNVSPDMDRLVLKLMSKRAKDRPAQVQDVYAELRRIKIFLQEPQERAAVEETSAESLVAPARDSRSDAARPKSDTAPKVVPATPAAAPPGPTLAVPPRPVAPPILGGSVAAVAKSPPIPNAPPTQSAPPMPGGPPATGAPPMPPYPGALPPGMVGAMPMQPMIDPRFAVPYPYPGAPMYPPGMPGMALPPGYFVPPQLPMMAPPMPVPGNAPPRVAGAPPVPTAPRVATAPPMPAPQNPPQPNAAIPVAARPLAMPPAPQPPRPGQPVARPGQAPPMPGAAPPKSGGAPPVPGRAPAPRGTAPPVPPPPGTSATSPSPKSANSPPLPPTPAPAPQDFMTELPDVQ